MTLSSEDAVKLLFLQGPIQRFTQDSPVLPDVWMAYAQDPGEQQDLLITPYQLSGTFGNTPGELSRILRDRLMYPSQARSASFSRGEERARSIAYNESEVVVRLYFDELVRVVLPISSWWADRVQTQHLAEFVGRLNEPAIAEALVDRLVGTHADGREEYWPTQSTRFELGPDVLWMVRVVGTILRAHEAELTRSSKRAPSEVWPPPAPEASIETRRTYYRRHVFEISKVFSDLDWDASPKSLVYSVNLNRKATVSVWKSSVAVKADAARGLFSLQCADLTWAVIDTGIDATHPAFQRRGVAAPVGGLAANSRVTKTFDFTAIRALLSSDPAVQATLPDRLRQALATEARLRNRLDAIRAHTLRGRDLDWKQLFPLIEIPHDNTYEPPRLEHGTHVAGILGADWKPAEKGTTGPTQLVQGMCPDIQMYDLRVLDDRGQGEEFNLLAALQFVRYLNSQQARMLIHGVNLSLSIPHQVMNYACGRTPVCEECDRLVQSGVVVVAAAGNRGHVRAMPPYVEETYRAISITDPGNGERVITVGATHRDMPHTYGVSYFSSRGPTGDGRIKPDLVAPGEKIESCVPGQALRRLDGTSMAAPHVSGAAALLMARHRELVGQPARIKEILCETATDLGRERYFQGHGMLDVLRALQRV